MGDGRQKKTTPGIRQGHGRGCQQTSCCDCPWEAFVYSKADEKKIRKTFPTREAAIAWRDDAKRAVRRNEMRAPVPVTVNEEAADAWLEGARAGMIRNRSGHVYKPATLRIYEQSLRLRILPELGREKLSAITRDNLQDLIDRLVASGLSASAVQGTLLPLRAMYGRACGHSSSGITVNPTSRLEMPAVRGGRDRIAPPDECTGLLEALPERDRALWATAMNAGVRRGELMPLRVEDVDLATGGDSCVAPVGYQVGRDRAEVGQGPQVPIAAVLRDYLDQHLLGLEWSEGLVVGSIAVSVRKQLRCGAGRRPPGSRLDWLRSRCMSAATRSRA